MLRKLKVFMPPIFVKFILKNLGYIGMDTWRYIPQGFSYVIKSKGWDLDSIAKLQADKWPYYAKRIKSSKSIGINHEANNTDHNDPFFHNLLLSFAYVFGLAALNKKNIKFLDWGGGIGHYGLLAETLIETSDINLEYYCYDFEVFNNYGKKLNPRHIYFNDYGKYLNIKFDLVMASGSIWYETDWRLGIDKLCKMDTDYLYITRMIFIQNKPSYVAIQKPKSMGYETEYLFWVINIHEFLAYVQCKAFLLIREFEFGEVSPIFKAPEQGTLKGFLFKKNKI